MEKSALQIARAAYQPKLPAGLRGNVSIKEGEPTQSVGNQEEIKALFPNTYGMPLVEFVPTDEKKEYAPLNIGIILSGGQCYRCRPPPHPAQFVVVDCMRGISPFVQR